MRLVTFIDRNETHIGALVSRDQRRYVLDLNRSEANVPSDMLEFLRAGHYTRAFSIHERYLLPESDVALLAPVPRPGKIICIGHNYHGHTGAVPPVYPDVFAKFANVVIGPNQPIVYPRLDINLDYEGELAVVIGKQARYVPQEHALEVVAGYTIFNDVTARDYQNRTSQWTLGKSFDTFGPLGPALVTADEVPDPGHLEITLWVNGEERQHSNTGHLIFPVPFLISYLSQAITLEPGDVISTGTPAGTGSSLKPAVYMQPGDQVRVRIEGIGELVNSVVAETVHPHSRATV